MKKITNIRRALIAMAFGFAATVQAQTTWTGGGSDGLWNTAANWDTGVPTEGVSAIIGSGNTVNYNAPMSATSFGTLTSESRISVNAAGFVLDQALNDTIYISGSAAVLSVNDGGAMTLSAGGITSSNVAPLIVNPGGVLTVAGTVTMGAGSGNGGDKAGVATNYGGTITAGGVTISPNNQNANCRFVILGGTNDLGDVVVQRSNLNPFGAPGPEGFLIYGGLVRMNSLDVGGNSGNSYLTAYVQDGVVTNSGSFTVRQITGGRASRFLQAGGLVVSEDPNGVLLRGHTANNSVVIYAVMGGTNLVQGFVLGDASDVTGTLRFTNSAKIYVGSTGFVQNGFLNTINIVLNSGGIFGAQADWTGAAPMIMNGGTFNAADLEGTPHNITLTDVLSGTGSLTKTGGGVLTLDGANTYSGGTIVTEGALVIGASGSINSSVNISIASNAVFDVTAWGGGFTLTGSQVLSGSGAVAGGLTAQTGNTIRPGDIGVAGTLTFSNGLTELGSVDNVFDLSSDPMDSSNDLVTIQGDLTLSGLNSIQINRIGGSLQNGGFYKLFEYTGSAPADVSSSFTVSGADGTLTNDTTAHAIYLHVESTIRPSADVTWTGGAANDDWDTLNSSNWLNGAVQDYFVSGDRAIFNATGAGHPMVNLVGSVMPADVLVNAAADYTFSGTGSIDGAGGLTKTNSGTLTVQTANGYIGVTTLGGGVLSALTLDNGGLPTAIGAASSDSSNIVFNGGTLEYAGASVSMDRGATLGGGNGTISVADAGATLTVSGQFTGSGALIKAGPGQLSVNSQNDYAGDTEVVDGTLRLDRTSGATLGSGMLILNGDADRSAVFLFGGDTQTLNNTLDVVGTNNFTQNNGNNTIVSVTGSGTLRLGAGGTTLTFSGDMSGFSGTLLADGLENLRLHPSTGSALATFDLGDGFCYLNNRNATARIQLGALKGGVSSELRGASSSDNTTTYFIGGNNADTIFDGSITETRGAAAVVKVGTGTLTLGSFANTYTGSTTVSNGVLKLTNDAAFDYTAIISVASPGVLDVASRFDGSLQLATYAAQTLQGDGVIRGSLYVNPSGTVAPGFSIGTLTVTNAVTLTGTAVFEIDGGASPNSDRIVADSISVGGTIIVTNIGGNLHAGQIFHLLDGTLTDNFPTIITPDGYTFDTSQLTTTGDIQVTGAPALPTISGVSINSSGLVFSVTNGTANQTFSILTSTNVTASLSSGMWQVMMSGNFDGNGAVTVTNAVDPAMPQSYFLLQTP